MSMTREQRKYWRKSAIHAVLGVMACLVILYCASYICNVIMAGGAV